MKKLWVWILLVLFVTSSTSFAQDRQSRDVQQKKIAIFKAAETIAQNRETIKALSDTLRSKTKETKGLIKVALENKETLTKEALNNYKQILLDLKANQAVLASTLGELKTHNEAVKLAKETRDFDAILEHYTAIILIQETRIEQLNEMISGLDLVISNLSE